MGGSAHWDLAQHYLGEAQWDKCLHHANAVIEIGDNNLRSGKALAARARALHETGDTNGALAALDEALIYAPDSYYVRNQRGIVFGAMGQVERQIEECRIALIDAPGDKGITYNLAHCLAAIGKFDESYQLFDYVARVRGRVYDWAWRGECQRRLGRMAEAGCDLAAALEMPHITNDQRDWIIPCLAAARAGDSGPIAQGQSA